MFWKLLKQEKYCTFGALHRIADGSIIPVEISAHYLKHKGKEYYAGYFHNISDRKKMRFYLSGIEIILNRRFRDKQLI